MKIRKILTLLLGGAAVLRTRLEGTDPSPTRLDAPELPPSVPSDEKLEKNAGEDSIDDNAVYFTDREGKETYSFSCFDPGWFNRMAPLYNCGPNFLAGPGLECDIRRIEPPVDREFPSKSELYFPLPGIEGKGWNIMPTCVHGTLFSTSAKATPLTKCLTAQNSANKCTLVPEVTIALVLLVGSCFMCYVPSILRDLFGRYVRQREGGIQRLEIEQNLPALEIRPMH